MQFKTMADVEAYRRRQGEVIHLRVQARDLCNALCHKLDWKRSDKDVRRINRVLSRARDRLARREQIKDEQVQRIIDTPEYRAMDKAQMLLEDADRYTEEA